VSPLSFQEAIAIIEHRGHPKLHEAARVFENRLQQLPPEEYEGRGICYYYLLLTRLRFSMPSETTQCLRLYEKMNEAFAQQEKKYTEISADKNKKELTRHQLIAFYKMIEQYFYSLEKQYSRHDFSEAKERAYLQKMDYRQKKFYAEKKWLEYGTYNLMNITSQYGTSFLRWGITSLLFVFAFGLIFYFVDFEYGLPMTLGKGSLLDYVYFSLVSFVTVGYGDIVPITALEKIIIMFEIVTGYVMLGILVALVSKKF
jgi:hypothetical protein